jgi:mono/diheme cytochrome c family protein
MKKLSFVLALGVIGFATAMNSCSSGSEQKAQKPETIVQKDASAKVAAANTNEMAAQIARGEQIYKEKCIVCHQADGKGLPGAFPPLAQSDYLLADKVKAVAQALNGSKEPITVNGQVYTAPMPPQVNTKEDAVAIINYVQNNFGNNGGYVTLEEVKDVVINPRP